MEIDDLETEILLRNALRLGVSSQARDSEALAKAIGVRLDELGFREVTACQYCRRRIPDFGVCPYCSAPRSGTRAAPATVADFGKHVTAGGMLQAVSQPVFWVVVLLATAPMVLKFFGLEEKWMFVYFSLFWGYVFFKVTRARTSLWRVGAIGYIFTGVVSLPLLLAWMAIPPHFTEQLVMGANGLGRLTGFIFGVGVREELAKVLAVVWMLRLKIAGRRLLTNPVEALLVGSLSGLGFAAIENMDYLERFQFLDKLHYTFGYYTDNLSFRGSMSRVMLTPFVHAVWAGIAAYFAASAMEVGGMRGLRLFAVGLLVASALHGFYDFFAGVAAGEMLVFSVVGLSFAVWIACFERAGGRNVDRALAV